MYAAALAVRHAGLRFRRATQHRLSGSEAQIDEVRAGFVTNLQQLRESGVRLDDPLNDFGDTRSTSRITDATMTRLLLQELAQTLRAAAPSLALVAPHLERARRSGRPRVGICSRFLYNQRRPGTARRDRRTGRGPISICICFQVPPLINDPLAKKIAQGRDAASPAIRSHRRREQIRRHRAGLADLSRNRHGGADLPRARPLHGCSGTRSVTRVPVVCRRLTLT